MASSNGTKRTVTRSALKTAQADAAAIHRELGLAVGSGTMPTKASADDTVLGDTPLGITADYEGAEDADIPVGALTDAQLTSLIKNLLLRGAASFLFRFHNQIYLRACESG